VPKSAHSFLLLLVLLATPVPASAQEAENPPFVTAVSEEGALGADDYPSMDFESLGEPAGRFRLHLEDLPATDLGPTVSEELDRRTRIRQVLSKPATIRLQDLVPKGSSLEREMRLARWGSPMGRLEYEQWRQQRAAGRNGLVGAERDIPLMLPLFTVKIGGQPFRIGIPLLGR